MPRLQGKTWLPVVLVVGLLLLLMDAGAGWVVHPLAGVALAFFASVIFSPRARRWPAVALSAVPLALLAEMGVEWVVHPAAGMLLGFFGSQAFHHWQTRWPSLLAGLVAALLFTELGASWLPFPLSVMGIIWLFTAVFTSRTAPGTARLEAPHPDPALPEQAGGWPMGAFGGQNGEREPVPVGGRTAPPQPRQAPSPDGSSLTAFVHNERLPGEARAQLAALDLRLREALTHLEASGQGGSEAAYLARTIRDEYAPTAALSYLKLPPTLANVQPLQDGKTGRDLLREQLDILLDAVQDLLGKALRSGGNELLTHQRFLEEKFRKPRGDLEV